MDRLSELLGRQVQFASTALDRIVLNGYLTDLQGPGSVVHFFHEVAGVACIEPAVLAERTERYRAWVGRFTAEQGMPVLAAPTGARKEDLARPQYRRRRGTDEGVACVLTSRETRRTFVSYTPRSAPPSGDADYRQIRACRKAFLHSYFYVRDPVVGPMSLRVASYLPFDLTASRNGHSFLARELTRLGLTFRQEDNAIVAVADPVALQAAADRLDAEVLRRRCDHWASQLAPRFSPDERAALHLRYRWSVGQLELATDVACARAAPLRALFGRAAELGILVGGADYTAQLFGRRITRRYAGKLQTVLDRQDPGRPVLRGYDRTSFVKQYQKADRLLRTEPCINDAHHLGVGRRLEHLPTLVERMRGTNQRFLALQAELRASTVDAGHRAALARPTAVGRRRVPGIRLHDDRVLRLLEALLHPGDCVADWTTRAVHARLLARHRLAEADYRLGQLRYDLAKLRAKGLVERLGTSRRYRLTPLGLKLGVLLVKLRTRLLATLATLAAEPTPRPARTPSRVEAAFRQVDAALDHLCATLGLAA